MRHVHGPLADQAGRLVERWLPARGDPGQDSGTDPPVEPGIVLDELGAVSARRRRWAVPAAVMGVLAALITTAVLVSARPQLERPPPLPVVHADDRDRGGQPAGVDAAVPGATMPQLVVSVVGKVKREGLVTLPAGARVADALEAAGGARRGVDLSTVNLARKLVDGEQIHIGLPASVAVAPGAGVVTPGEVQAKVNLNTATREQLDALPGVGEVTAQRILDWRARHGTFTAVEQLREIDGIGERRLADLREQVTVG